MNGIKYFRLNSPYEGDVTKNCALTGSEIDNNFFTLEGRDIKSVEIVDDKIVITLLNGQKLTTDSITEDCVKDISFSFDEVNGILTITQDGVEQVISGFLTEYNAGGNEAVSVDGTLIGNGLAETPIGISPIAKTGQYRPVQQIIRIVDGEQMPNRTQICPGDRFLTVENINDYGFLYNYEGVKKLVCQLREAKSPWRLPTKADWDDMLDAVEPIDDFRNHTDARSNKFLGHIAGKLLKSKEYWKKEVCPDDCNDSSATAIVYDETSCESNECSCGTNNICHPDYCGEYGSCHHRHHHDNRGVDKYGFRVVPAGYANEAKDYLYFKERAYFWTATNHEYRDAYIKAFAYNKSSVLQDIMATDNYMSVRLVKDYNGNNFNEREDILGGMYSTVLMPSMKHGKAIWTSVNISAGDCGCGCKHILPNDGQGMEYSKKYFINEWTGNGWMRKELADGESVVVIKEHNANDHGRLNLAYTEYRVVNGELVDVASLIYNNVVETFRPKITEIETNIEILNDKVDAEITRSTTKDAELESSINMLTERVTADEQNIEKNTQDIATLNTALEAETQARETKDAELEEAINDVSQALEAETQARETKDAELEEAINDVSQALAEEAEIRAAKDIEIENKHLVQEGTEFDKNTGTLTLKSKGGVNDVHVQFGFNFGTF